VAKAFSVAAWNVEHFQDKQGRNEERIEFLAEQKPDVVAIFEVEGKDVWRELMDTMKGYSFFITEGQNSQEILLGIAPGITGFLTQRTEFQENNAFMRPGALLSVEAHGERYALLFLHVASWPQAGGFGLRADMIDRAFEFRKVLDKAAGGKARYIFLGDLNSMGLDYVYGKTGTKLDHDRIPAEHEIGRLAYLGTKYGMRLLSKNSDATWGDPKKKSMRSNLDHVLASDDLTFKSFGGAEIDVRGWPKLPEAEQAEWMTTYSDHALLYFEVQRP
jgi:exonuclease III